MHVHSDAKFGFPAEIVMHVCSDPDGRELVLELSQEWNSMATHAASLLRPM